MTLEEMRKILICTLMMLTVMTFSACGTSDREDRDDVKTTDEAKATDEPEATDEPGTKKFYNDENIEDTYEVDDILYYDENYVTQEIVTDEDIEGMKKVPNSTITYVAVDGHGKVCGMGVPYQQYAVGVRADSHPGYRYAGCESETIEFYEYAPNEYLGYDVPWFLVPDSGEHVIYVYFEQIEE